MNIQHPVTGAITTTGALAREFGIPADVVRKRARSGRAGYALIASYHTRRRPGELCPDIRRPAEMSDWLASPAGRLTTRIFRDYGGAR